MTSTARLDWDDLRYLLAIARHGSTIAAGKALGISQSTVHRRIQALERHVGQSLVHRHPSGYRITAFAETLLPHAENVEAAVAALERQIGESTQAAAGAIRLTCPEPIVYRLTQSSLLERFHEGHPGLHVEFVTSDRYLDLSAGDADVALRSGDTDADLVGLKVADSLWAVYAARSYVERHGVPDAVGALAGHALVALDKTMHGHRAARWLDTAIPEARIAARNSSILGLVSAVRSGIGIGALPTALGDAEPDLVRAFGPIPELTRSWRLLTTRALRKTPRVAALFTFFAAQRRALKPILTG